jgi:hypothetical protein
MKTLILLAMALALSGSAAFAGGRCIEWRHHHCVQYQHYDHRYHEQPGGVGVHFNGQLR